ncbi:hypothetical protein GCK72_007586 [Caenorhabditis remanei]|uniref:Uncharacterized protein n=1 Tax=Caenorhabditis remanei TaxID=31234 RepID=A0A6A5HMI6_CAERE|nr:hypothetical protein GCK72_007586 [Caenorhabditis remanei]KAF1767627.1 hypothetical protein GCK72_007586 [Caenorhabditis remanei]
MDDLHQETGKTWRYAKFESYETVIIDAKNANLSSVPKSYIEGYSMGKLELLNPLQRFVGCGSKSGVYRNFSVCLVGTEGNFTFFDASGKSKEVPGSDCHNRYKNDDGLCVANNEEEESYDGHPQDIFDDANQIRQEYSKNFNVPNMHQLKFIACRKYKPYSFKEIYSFKCLLGPENDSGVCVAINPGEESYFGRQLDFISDINQIRRRYAKEYRVPNMHELTWSNDLAEVLEPLHMTGVRAQAKKTWRYGAINTYDNIIYQIEKGVTFFFESNRTAKKIHIKSLSDKETMDRLEFLNPLQKTIACGRKEDGGVTLIICLLGPEGNFTIFDTSFQSQLAAGSKCDKGYYNEDGLCIMQIPTQEPIIDYRKMAEEEINKASTDEPEPEPLLENHGNGISLSYLFVFLLANLIFNI